MAEYPSPLSATVRGAIAGLAGTAAITVAMQKGPQLMERFGISVMPESPESPAAEEPQEGPTATLAGRVAGGVLETPLDPETRQTAGQAVHWGYGAMWGAVFGIVHSSVRWPLLLHGALFGIVVATVASTLVPAMGLAPRPTEQPKRISAMQMVYHLIYGWVTALAFRALMARN